MIETINANPTWIEQENELKAASLPAKTRTYTPISHGRIINAVSKLCKIQGFDITDKDYSIGKDAQVMTGKYTLNYGNEDMSIFLAFQNSYNKKVTAKFVTGAKIFICSNGMLTGDFPFKSKHTGNVDIRYFEAINESISKSKDRFEETIRFSDNLKRITLTQKETDRLLGSLLRKRKWFTDSQFLNFRQEYLKKAPTIDYGVEKNCLWNLYNLATYAIEQRSNSNNYISGHLEISDFFKKAIAKGDTSLICYH
tara:strand:- start:882 stop:1643 length:762 start_codon:yes stop_codon:yes gene_type:complete